MMWPLQLGLECNPSDLYMGIDIGDRCGWLVGWMCRMQRCDAVEKRLMGRLLTALDFLVFMAAPP